MDERMKDTAHLWALNLQLFAGEVDWRKVVETKPPEDGDDEPAEFVPQPLFRTAMDGDENSNPEADEGADEDLPEFDPIFMPRLNVTDSNLPYTAAGELVVADEDGNLSTASVDEDGTLTQTAIMIDGEMIADETITGSKLEEHTITSREIDMEELFSDSTLLSELVAEHIDTDGLFENPSFLDRVNAHVSETAVMKAGSTMTGQLTLSGVPTNGHHAASKQYVDEAIASSSDEVLPILATLPRSGWAADAHHEFKFSQELALAGMDPGEYVYVASGNEGSIIEYDRSGVRLVECPAVNRARFRAMKVPDMNVEVLISRFRKHEHRCPKVMVVDLPFADWITDIHNEFQFSQEISVEGLEPGRYLYLAIGHGERMMSYDLAGVKLFGITAQKRAIFRAVKKPSADVQAKIAKFKEVKT